MSRELSKKDKQYLIDLKHKPNENDVRYKEIIKQELLNDDVLIYLLNNSELENEEAENDEYFNVNIKPEYIIPETQTEVDNFVCYETEFDAVARYNPAIKVQKIIFYILCHEKNNVVRDIGAERHDLIAALLIDKFNGSNIFGNQLKLVSDKPSTTDTHYATRTLIFEQETTNSLTRADGRSFNLRR